MKSYLERSSLLVLALLGACQPAKAFQCAEDGDCTLSGKEGICVSTSRCAYPDDACPSGYAYPEGSGDSLSGVCLPPGVLSATDGAPAAADTDTSSSGSEGSGT